MNNVRRKEIRSILSQLEDNLERLQTCFDEEEEYRDNMPENLWNSCRYEDSENASDILSDSIDSISTVIENLYEIVG